MKKVRELNSIIVKQDLEKIFSYKSSNANIQSIIERGFVFSDINDIKKSSVLFIGMNPSFSKGAKIESYFYDVKKAVEDYPKHYKNFSDLINKTDYGDNWTYIDLFFFRETNQKSLSEIIKNDAYFIVNQLRLTYEIIRNINPDIIVVANSEATNFFGINKYERNDSLTNVWFGFDFVFENGFHIIKSRCTNTIIDDFEDIELFETPFIFTGTLKYMNKYDKERLSWLINNYKNSK